MNNLLFDFTVDKSTKTVFVTREFEADLIQQFVKTYGCRPFANLAN